WLRIAVVGALGAQLALIVADQVMHPPRPPLPQLLGTELSLVGQRQNWHMFAPDAPVEDVSWCVPAQLGDGGTVELTRALIPELANDGGFIYSRWHRLRNTMATKRPDLLLPLGRYICRRWKGTHPETPLARFDLVAVVRPVLSAAPPEEKVIFRQACTRTV